MILNLYEQLVYDDVPHNLPKIFGDAMRDRLVLCGSASKGYAMTGWRCGWVLGPKSIVSGANALQSHETSNVNSITQKAAVAALMGSQDGVAEMRVIYKQRRDRSSNGSAKNHGLWSRCRVAPLYLFPTCDQFLTPSVPTSQAFTDGLLATEHVVVTPAEAFESTGAFRLSYATSLERLREGVTRLIRYAHSIK